MCEGRSLFPGEFRGTASQQRPPPPFPLFREFKRPACLIFPFLVSFRSRTPFRLHHASIFCRERKKRREKVIFRIFPSFFFFSEVVFSRGESLYTAINLNGCYKLYCFSYSIVSFDISRNIRCKIERNLDIFICRRKECSTPSLLAPRNEKKEEKVPEDTKDKTSDGIGERKERNLKGRLDIFVP